MSTAEGRSARTTQESGLRENRTSRLSERTEEGRQPDLLRLYANDAGPARLVLPRDPLDQRPWCSPAGAAPWRCLVPERGPHLQRRSCGGAPVAVARRTFQHVTSDRRHHESGNCRSRPLDCDTVLPSLNGQTRAEALELFKKSLPATLETIRAGLPKGTPIELWWQDEARVGQKNKIARRWARRGTRPRAPHDQRTSSVYIFGAICPQQGKGAALVLPRCDTQAMSLHLAEVAQAVAPGAHGVMLMDRAGWHRTKDLVVPDNLTLVLLPARAPELNPVENIWQFLRDNWLSSRVFASYRDIVDHCCDAWNRLIDQPWLIMSIGLRDWANA